MPILTPARSVAAALLVLLTTTAFAASSRQVDAAASSHQVVDSSKPTIYGHRGASGYRPEHTLDSYVLAARMGADYIEPDLVSTKDHVLVARHENEIGATTDVEDHPEFADRKTTKVIDGVTISGWFTEDFTLAELKTLRAEERLPEVRQHNTLYNGRYKILTFQEIIDLRDRLSRELHRKVGLLPELKHSTYFRSIGLPLEKPFVATLRHEHLDNVGAKLTVQSPEISCLKELNKVIPNPLLQGTGGSPETKPGDVLAAGGTTTFGQMRTPAGLKEIAAYADIVAASKDYVISRNPDGTLGKPTSFVNDAHAVGLKAAVYTFRNENTFLPTDLRVGDDPSDYGNALEEYRRFYATGLDAVFSDNTDTAKAAQADK
ncbi:glycerophosphodiester phosphodiesterase family protein [Streptomyces scopuliridis]